MKFTIPTQEFNYLMNKCLSIIAPKPTLPILGNVMVEAKNGILSLTSSDMLMGVRCFVEANIQEEGATTLPAKKLASLLRELTSANVQVTTSPSHVTEIRSDSSRFKINGMAKDTYPELPDMSEATQFSVPQTSLKKAFHRTAFAVSREESRYVFTGVCMKISHGNATFFATDGKRLARNLLPVNTDPAFIGSFTIPLKAVEECLKSLTEDGEAKIYVNNEKFALQTADTFIVSVLLTEDYPDLSQVIPQSVEKFVGLHKDELTVLLKQVSLFTSETPHMVQFSFTSGELNLSAQTAELGDGKVSMPVNYEGEPMEIAFNPMYFLDILRHSVEETVSLGISDSFSPGVLTDGSTVQYESTLANPLYVLMPLKRG